MNKDQLKPLIAFLGRIPAVTVLSSDVTPDRLWWIKLVIDTDSELAWNVVQELGCVLNYLSIEERLPTLFMPVSPAPYLNGGPKDYLSWVIESRLADVDPSGVAETLEGRLPRPVDDLSQWAEE